MLNIVIVTPETERFKAFASAFTGLADVALSWADTGQGALAPAVDLPADLVVADETLSDMTGLEFAEKLIRRNPMINCACVSTLSKADFHEASEGLGLMPQLPPGPGKADGESLLSTLKQLKGES